MPQVLLMTLLMMPGPLGQPLAAHVRLSRMVQASSCLAARNEGVSGLLPLARFEAGRAAKSEPSHVIRATGVGHPPPHRHGARARLMARRAGQVRAVRNLAAALGCHGRTTIRGFRYSATTYRADGSVEVVVECAPGRCRATCRK
jgi:hypothetical protein